MDIPSLLDKYRPNPEWLLFKSQFHGIDHLTRVLILQEQLADLLIKDGLKLDREALRWAATTHDLRRINDNDDPFHGKRAAEWVVHTIQNQVPSESIDLICYINEWHCIDKKWIPHMPPELALLKDADALDRVRLSDLNIEKLYYAQSHKLISFAQDLFRVGKSL